MEDAGNILEAVLEEDEYEDTEMLDAEEGELVGPDSVNDMGRANGDDSKGSKQEKNSKNCRRRANRRKNKRKRGPESNVTDINRLLSNISAFFHIW